MGPLACKQTLPVFNLRKLLFKFYIIIFIISIQVIRERLLEKKHQLSAYHKTLGIHWNFAYWPEEIFAFVFLHIGEFVFPLRRLFCSLTFTFPCL